MTAVHAVTSTRAGRALAGARWWLRLVVPGIVLLLTPAAATGITNRDPDPLFMHSWWTPIAQAPTPTLVLGSIGLDLLLATGVVALVHRLVPTRRPVRPATRSAAAVSIAVLIACGWSLTAAAHSNAWSSDIARALTAGSTVTPRMSVQESTTVAQVLAWPTDPISDVHIVTTSSVPAGPFLVQTTEVRNEDAQDEGADVVVETLVDPIDGHITAAWYYGM